MKHVSFTVRPVLMACAAAGMATQGMVSAQDSDQPTASGWSFRAGAEARFNIKASVQNVVPATGTGLYDDGFVKPDVSGSATKTWNWGYNSSSQVSGDQIRFQQLYSVPTIQSGNLSDPAIGGEIAARYAIYEFEIGNKTGRLGFEFGYGFSTFSGNLSSAASGTANLTTYDYRLGGITPPEPPYAGTAAGPGPLLDTSNPTVNKYSSAESTSFNGKLSADFHDIRLGPTFEIDLTKRLSASFGLGYSAVYADAKLSYSETTKFADPNFPIASSSSSASISKGAWLPGVYTSLMLDYKITKHIGVFAEGDFRYNQQLNFGDATHQAKFDLGSTFGAKGGVIFWF